MSIPLITVQPDALETISDVTKGHTQRESFWISYKDLDHPTVYGDIDVYKANNQTELRPLGPLTAKQGNSHELTISYNSKQWLTRFPQKDYSQLDSNIMFTSIDVSPSNEHMLLGTSDGGLQLVTTDNGTIRRQLEGHIDHTVVGKFFPSGQAAISAGIDMQIKIWNLADSSNPRTLIGHTQSPVDVVIIGRGRNIVSGSKDSTVRLWECGSGQSIHTFKCDSPVNAIALADFNEHDLDIASKQSAPFEYDTEGKSLFVSDKHQVYLFDLRSKETEQNIVQDSEWNQVSALATNGRIVTFGSKSGTVTGYDCRNFKKPLFNFKKSNQEIKQLILYSSILSVISEDNVTISTNISNEVNDATYLICSNPANAGVMNSNGLYLAGKNGMALFYAYKKEIQKKENKN